MTSNNYYKHYTNSKNIKYYMCTHNKYTLKKLMGKNKINILNWKNYINNYYKRIK